MLLAQIEWQGIVAILGALSSLGLGAWVIKLMVTRNQLQRVTRTDAWNELGEVIRQEREGREADKKHYNERLKEKREELERAEARNEKLEAQVNRCHKSIQDQRELSEKDRAEIVLLKRRLAKNQARMISMLHGSKSFLLVAESSGRILYVGPEVVLVLGWLPSQLEGENLLILTPDRLKGSLIQVLRRVSGSSDSDLQMLNELRRVDSYLMSPNGNEVPVMMAAYWTRTEYSDFIMFADVSRLDGKSDGVMIQITDPGHTDEGPMKGLENLPEEKTPPPI